MSRVRRSPSGHRIAEHHHNARLKDEDVPLVLSLHEAGLGYGTISRKLDDYEPPISRSVIQRVCNGDRFR